MMMMIILGVSSWFFWDICRDIVGFVKELETPNPWIHTKLTIR